MSVHRDGPCACGSGKKYKNCCLRREHREAQRTSQHATAFVTLGGDTRRSLLAINIGEAKNRIEPFARTLRFADEGKAWLQQLAGDSIRYLDREVVAPVTILSRRDGSSGSGEASPREKAP